MEIAAVNCCSIYNRTSREFTTKTNSNLEDMFLQLDKDIDKTEHFTGKHKCKARPFSQRMFSDGAYLEDNDDIFR